MISKKYYSLVLAAILNIQIIGCISDFNTDTANVQSYLKKEQKTIAKGPYSTMLPRGTVLMIATDQIDYWFNIYGQGLGEYLGWYLCDGRNGTPDLTGRVPIGRDLFNSQSEYHKIGMTGGTESFRLTENQIPRHSHNINLKTDSTGQHSHAYTDTLFPQACQPWPDYGLWFTEEVYPAPQRRKANYINRENWSADSGSHSHELKGRTETSGDSMPVDIRQPYYVVSYIIFLGTVGGNVNDILVG